MTEMVRIGMSAEENGVLALLGRMETLLDKQNAHIEKIAATSGRANAASRNEFNRTEMSARRLVDQLAKADAALVELGSDAKSLNLDAQLASADRALGQFGERDRIRSQARDWVRTLDDSQERANTIRKGFGRAKQHADPFFSIIDDAPEKLGALQDLAGQVGDDLSNMWSGGLDGAVGFAATLVGVEAAIEGVQAMIAMVIDKQRQLREETAAEAITADEAIRRFQVQGNLPQHEAKEARKNIAAVSIANAASLDDAYAIATQLQSSGFGSRPDRDGTLDVVQDILDASNLDHSQGVESVKAMGQFLVGFGKEKTAANLLDLGVATRGLFKETDVQVSDLGAFARAAPTFSRAGVSQQDTLAALGVLREGFDPGEAATFGRNIVSALSTGKVGPKPFQSALDRLGLKPEDVDLVGETLPDALAKIGGALSKLPQEDRLATLKQLFEKESVAGASVLIASVTGDAALLDDAVKSGLEDDPEKLAKLRETRFDQLVGFQRDEAGFEDAVRTRQSGVAAVKRRQDAKERADQIDNEEIAVAEENRRRMKELNLNDALRRSEKLEGDSAMGKFRRAGMILGSWLEKKGVDFGVTDEQNALRAEEAQQLDEFGQGRFNIARTREQLQRQEQERAAAKRREENRRIDDEIEAGKRDRFGNLIPPPAPPPPAAVSPPAPVNPQLSMGSAVSGMHRMAAATERLAATRHHVPRRLAAEQASRIS